MLKNKVIIARAIAVIAIVFAIAFAISSYFIPSLRYSSPELTLPESPQTSVVEQSPENTPPLSNEDEGVLPGLSDNNEQNNKPEKPEPQDNDVVDPLQGDNNVTPQDVPESILEN